MDFWGQLYEYDPIKDVWRWISRFPLGSRPGTTGFALKGSLYFGCGSSGDGPDTLVDHNDFWKYEPTLNRWMPVADFAGEARTYPQTFTIGDRAYVGFGTSGADVFSAVYYTDLWSYNAVRDEWTRMADFPITNGTFVFNCGLTYANTTSGYIGALDGNHATDHCNVYEYNTGVNLWAKVNAFPSGVFSGTSPFLISERSFLIGGWSSKYSKQVWAFTP